MDTRDDVLSVPYVRFLRFNNKPIFSEPVPLRYNRAHEFIIAAAPANLTPTAVLVEISGASAGTATSITLTKLGGSGAGGQLWTGTITNSMLTGKKQYLLRVTNSTGASACELEIKNSKKA